MRRALVAAAFALLLGAVPGGAARRIAHERVPFAPSERGPQPAPSPIAQPGSGLPDAIRYRDNLIAAPSRTPTQRDDEPILRPSSAVPGETAPSALAPEPATPAPGRRPPAPDGPPEPRRARTFSPDPSTGTDPVLRYAIVFQPSIAPFKRFDVMDAITADFGLAVRDPRLGQLFVGGGPRAGRELFFGSVVILASGATPVPIPSVSPTSRILRYETAPTVPVRFFRDGADNYYAVADHRGPVRLNFLTDAPATYFGAPLPAVRAEAVPEAIRPRLPEAVGAAAREVLRQLGVPLAATLDTQLGKLVAHFRAFRAGETRPSRSAEELFRKLATGGVGACRHRAYAFVLLAQALGLPARFVANEAHAFAEVWVPEAPTLRAPALPGGWRRIDLGGVSPELVVYGGGDRVPHKPQFPDPFARPASFENAYSARTSAKPEPARSGPMSGPSAPIDSPATAEPMTPEPATPNPPPAAAAPAERGREPTVLRLTKVQRDVLRGESLLVAGRLETLEGRGVPGVRVEVSLAQETTDARRDLGVLLTDTTGRFRARLPVPRDLETGRFELQAEAFGDERHAPASSAP